MIKITGDTSCNIKTEAKNINIKNKINTPSKNTNSTDLSVLNNYKRDLVSFRGVIKEGENPLDIFKAPQDMKMPAHKMYFFKNEATFSVLMDLFISNGFWIQTPEKTETSIPWKIHLYADCEEDWAKLVASVGRYLNTQPVVWKTLSGNAPVDKLNEDELQKGKAFTIYPADKEQFKKLAHDIDYIVRLNNLEKEDSAISGDRKLGTSGRIFYRYEDKSGQTKDKVYSNSEIKEYYNNYESNRGADNYLAYDMTFEDDPFYTFDPKESLE